MNQRAALYDLAAIHRLDAGALLRLQRLAGLEAEPDGLELWLPRGIAMLAAALVGLGVILWVAANWDAWGRLSQFMLLEGLVLALSLGALAQPGARSALGLLALLAVGGLLAYFGQTYQTGADPWQLFALWAGLCLPLALAARSDVLWAAWALVAMTGITLWVQAHTGPTWRVAPQDLSVHLAAWAMAAAVSMGLAPAFRHLTGAGIWAQRLAVTLAVTLVTLSALAGLFNHVPATHYWLGLLVLAGAAALLALPRAFDVSTLSAVALGLNTLVVAGFGYWLLDGHHGGDPVGEFLVIGLVAALVLAASVSAILGLVRRYSHGGDDHV
jgi:uncharacterized membrane protein